MPVNQSNIPRAIIGESPIVDGFVHSASLLYLSTTYRASVMQQMDVLRRARSYRCRWFNIPDNLNEPILAFSQVEQQIHVRPGSYWWATSGSAPGHLNGDAGLETQLFVKITDSCTEVPFESDYTYAISLYAPSQARANARNPMLSSQPRLVGEPGLLNVEIYNKFDIDLFFQLVLFVAEPMLPPDQIINYLENAPTAQGLCA